MKLIWVLCISLFVVFGSIVLISTVSFHSDRISTTTTIPTSTISSITTSWCGVYTKYILLAASQRNIVLNNNNNTNPRCLINTGSAQITFDTWLSALQKDIPRVTRCSSDTVPQQPYLCRIPVDTTTTLCIPFQNTITVQQESTSSEEARNGGENTLSFAVAGVVIGTCGFAALLGAALASWKGIQQIMHVVESFQSSKDSGESRDGNVLKIHLAFQELQDIFVVVQDLLAEAIKKSSRNKLQGSPARVIDETGLMTRNTSSTGTGDEFGISRIASTPLAQTPLSSQVDPMSSSQRNRNQLRMAKGTLLLLKTHQLRLSDPEKVAQWEKIVGNVVDIIENMSCEVIHCDFQELILCWNINKVCPEHAFEACKNALKIQNVLEKGGLVDYGIAITSGEIMCGFMGSKFSRYHVVVGEARVRAEQLHALCDVLNTRILITQDISDNIAQDTMVARVVDVVKFHSRFYQVDESVYVFELLKSSKASGTLTQFKHIFSLFCEGNYDGCERLLNIYLEKNPDDTHAQRLNGMLRHREELNIDTPYCRQFAGWERMNTPGEKETNAPTMNRPMSAASFRFRANQHTERLKEDVDRAIRGARKPRARREDPSASSDAEDGPVQQDIVDLVEDDLDNESQSSFSEDDIDNPRDVVPRCIVDLDRKTWKRGLRPVGQGQTAQVYLGMSETGNLVALKIIKLDAEKGTALVKEVELLAKLRAHHNILPYLTCAVVDKHMIIVTPFVSGGALDTLLDQFGPLPLSILRRFLRDIVRGIRHLHSQSVMHSDIKPANVLLDTDGICKLSDFGTASHMGGPEGLRGTPMYMAPEQARGHPCSASDIWALGIMILVLATNKSPFGDTTPELFTFVWKMGQEKLDPTIPGDLDADLMDLVKICLAKDSAKRPTADAVYSHPFLL